MPPTPVPYFLAYFRFCYFPAFTCLCRPFGISRVFRLTRATVFFLDDDDVRSLTGGTPWRRKAVPQSRVFGFRDAREIAR